jgi:hypothetical protein
VAILVAVFMVLLMGLAAIVVDLGFARDRARVAQNASDAAALAAAQYLSTRPNPFTPTPAEFQAASTRALEFISANGWSAGGAVSFDQTGYVVTVALNPEAPRSFFSGAVGGGGPPVARDAAARWAVAGPPGLCSVCIFGDLEAQNGDIFLTNGDLRAGGAITVSPNGNVETAGGSLYAGNLAGSTVGGNFVPTPLLQQVGAVPDPFAGVPEPPVGAPIAGSPNGNCTPGTYASIDNCSSFAPGIYVVTAASRWTGNTGATGNGVLFYLTCANGNQSARCAPGQSGGSISTNGGPGLQLSFTPSNNPLYGDLVVFGDRNNAAVNDIQGGSLFSTGPGSFYMKAGELSHGGNPEIRIGGNLVVGRYSSNGNPNPAFVTGTSAASPLPPPGGGVGLVD